MTTSTESPATSVRTRAVTIAAAAAAGAVVWLVAVPIAGVELEVKAGSSYQTVGLVAVVVTGLVVGSVAALLLALLERRTGRARTIWTVVAAVVLAVSLGGPLGARTAGAGVALAAMHLAVGLVLIVGLRSAASGRR